MMGGGVDMRVLGRSIMVKLSIGLLLLVALVMVSQSVMAIQYDVDLVYKDHTHIKEAIGLNPISFNYSITHTGDVISMEVNIDAINLSTGWQIVYTATTRSDVYTDTSNPSGPDMEILIVKGETASLSLYVRPPPNALAGIYWMELEVWPSKDRGQTGSHEFAVVIGQFADFEIELVNPPPDGCYKAIPPAVVTVRFALYNTGNGDDRFLVKVESSRTDDGWTHSEIHGVNERGITPILPSDMTKASPHYIDLKVPFPTWMRGNESCTIDIIVTSVFNTSKEPATASALLCVKQVFDLDVTFQMSTGPFKPGDRVTIVATLVNEGNGWDHFDITVETDDPQGDPFEVDIDPSDILLDRDESGTVTIVIDLPSDAEDGMYTLSVFVWSRMASEHNLGTTMEFEVIEAYKVEVSTETSSFSTIPGGLLEYYVTVTNAGTELDVYGTSILDAPFPWLVQVQPPEVTLLEGQSADVKIVVILPSSFEEAPIGVYHLTVHAESPRSAVQAQLVLELEVVQFFRIEMTLDGNPVTDPDRPRAPDDILDPIPVLDPSSEDPLAIKVGAINFGNGWDNVTFTSSVEDKRISVTIEPYLIYLASGATKYISVRVRVPSDMPSGMYTVVMNANSQDPDMETRIAPLRFEVKTTDLAVPPTPTFLHPDDGAVVLPTIVVGPGEEVVFTLDVTNRGSRVARDVALVGWQKVGIGDDQEVAMFLEMSIEAIPAGRTMTIGDGSDSSLAWSWETSGVYLLEFEISFPGQSNNDNDVSTVIVIVNEPPVVEVDNEHITVTEGDTIEITGTVNDDHQEINWVRYRIDDGPWEDANGTSEWSIVIEETDLPTGEHRLQVVAYDGYDESPVLETTFEVEERFHVDDSPGIALLAVVLVILAAPIVLYRYRRGLENTAVRGK
jgi:uncharacterized membrane protein